MTTNDFLIFPALSPVHSSNDKSIAKSFLDNVGGRNSEMTLLSFYFTSSFYVSPSLQEKLYQMIEAEKQHLFLFASLAKDLSEKPLLWSNCGERKVFWSPSFTDYKTSENEIITHAIHLKESLIHKYSWQKNKIKDPSLQKILDHIIQEELLQLSFFQSI